MDEVRWAHDEVDVSWSWLASEILTVGYMYNINFAKYAEVNPGVHNVNFRIRHMGNDRKEEIIIEESN